MSASTGRDAMMVGHYKLLEHIGIGGLGDVYRARDTKLGRTVAIKLLPATATADPQVRQLLLQHGKAVARLSHPSIATLFDVGEEDDRVYFVFEYVPGEYLSSVVAGRPMNPRRVIEFGIQLADALAEAHGEEFVHGDIHGDSILVTPKDRVKLLDFGFARSLSDDPEARSLTASDDIRAVGRVLFEMLTGRPVSSTPHQSMPAASTQAPGVPREVDPIIARAVAVDPERRYQTAATMAAELRGAAAILDIRMTASEAQSASPGAAVLEKMRRPAFVALAIAAAVGVGSWMWGNEARRHWKSWFGPPPSPVLVVAPFALDGVSATIADGIAEDIAMRLGTVPGLRVVGRSALRASRGRDPIEIARNVHAAAVLMGTIGGDSERISLDARVLDVETRAIVWRQNFVSPKTQLLTIQASLMHEVAAAVGLESAQSQEYERTAARVINPAAYELCLHGREADSRGDSAAAIRLYEQATRADGSLAECHAALAIAIYRELQRERPRDEHDARQRIRRAADNAVAADPDLPAAQLAAGIAGPTAEDALVSFRQAVQLDPSAAPAYRQLADQIRGFEPERAAALRRAVSEFEPKGLIAGESHPASS